MTHSTRSDYPAEFISLIVMQLIAFALIVSIYLNNSRLTVSILMVDPYWILAFVFLIGSGAFSRLAWHFGERTTAKIFAFLPMPLLVVMLVFSMMWFG